MKILGYECSNEEKLERAINGNGNEYQGVGQDAPDEIKLAEYDKLGGLISKGGDKIKSGSFWDVYNKRPRKEPEVIFVYRDETDVVEVPEGTKIPKVVQVKQMIKKEKAKIRKAKKEDKKEDKK